MFPQKYLTDEEIKSLKPKAKPYKISMGNSLHLNIQPNGSIYWRAKYRLGGKEKTLSIGTYPKISISEARKILDNAKVMMRNGVDPTTVMREEKREVREESKRRKFETSFKLDLAEDGGIVIARNNKTLSLTAKQTGVLKTFLNAMIAEGSDE